MRYGVRLVSEGVTQEHALTKDALTKDALNA